jgi:membrane protein YdbS with pleckstrin-like domain
MTAQSKATLLSSTICAATISVSLYSLNAPKWASLAATIIVFLGMMINCHLIDIVHELKTKKPK